MEKRELRNKEKCPCDSGKIYSSCCKKKAFRWLIDDNGSYYKEIPLTDEALVLINDGKDYFQQIFEREPRYNDPVFLSKYIYSDDAIEKETVWAMQQADIEPHIIYAYQKTQGLLLTHENEHLATTEDLKEWEDAIQEYFQLKTNSSHSEIIDSLLNSLYEETDSWVIPPKKAST